MSDVDGKHIQMFSLHGLLRSENLELGRDADTGGQIKYVLELAASLSQMDDVGLVELFTRLIDDKAVSEDYAQPVEQVNDKFRIVRIQCGGKKYMRKELLWPYLDEYVDKTIKYIKLQQAIPDVVHGHYPDAGYVATQLSEIFGLPLVYTGHSLGRSKLERLLNDGMTKSQIDKHYKIDRRIEEEENILKKSDLVVASTHQEVDVQYAQYENQDVPSYAVIPPGLNVDKFFPYYHGMLSDKEVSEMALYARASVQTELNRFFSNPDRPLILSLCRPDKRKNISGLIEAYGEDLELRSMANLAVFAGIRKDISKMEDNERDVLTELLLLMDKYDLYGRIAIPKRHDFEHEVPELYRLAASKRGVFVNSALTEPFGLTLIEAASCGLPFVAPKDGGPRDIVRNCRCGDLVETTDTAQMASAIKRILSDEETWQAYSKAGIMNVRRYYTWENHATQLMRQIKTVLDREGAAKMKRAVPSDAIGRRLAKLNFMLVTDLDNTLIGGPKAALEKLLSLLRKHRKLLGFAVTTGRHVDACRSILEKHGVHPPDIIISSTGSEIYYGKNCHYGKGWDAHISAKWHRKKIVDLLKDLDFLTYREGDCQGRFRIAYEMAPGKDQLARVHKRLTHNKCRYTLVCSSEDRLDILPFRASKNKAVRYLSYKWEIPLKNFMICGDSGGDEEMLRGEPLGVVVGNHTPEMEVLRGRPNIYFAEKEFAGGILEAIEKNKILEKARQ